MPGAIQNGICDFGGKTSHGSSTKTWRKKVKLIFATHIHAQGGPVFCRHILMGLEETHTSESPLMLVESQFFRLLLLSILYEIYHVLISCPLSQHSPGASTSKCHPTVFAKARRLWMPSAKGNRWAIKLGLLRDESSTPSHVWDMSLMGLEEFGRLSLCLDSQ